MCGIGLLRKVCWTRMSMGVELGARARDLLATWRELVSGVAICGKKDAQREMEGRGREAKRAGSEGKGMARPRWCCRRQMALSRSMWTPFLIRQLRFRSDDGESRVSTSEPSRYRLVVLVTMIAAWLHVDRSSAEPVPDSRMEEPRSPCLYSLLPVVVQTGRSTPQAHIGQAT